MSPEETPIVPAPEAPAPRSFGDLFGESLSTYWDALAVFIGIAAVALVPQALLSGALWSIGRYAAGEDQTGFTWNLLFPLGSMVVTALAYPLMEGALIHAAAERQAGRRIGVFGAYSAIFPKAGLLIGAWLLVALLILLFVLPLFLLFVESFGIPWSVGFVLLVILAPLACYFGIRWMLVLQQVVIEGSGVGESLGRSSDLVSGNWWRSFGIWVLLGAIPSFLIGVPVAIILSAWSAEGFATIVIREIVPSVFVAPLSAVSLTLLHFDLRARKDQLVPRPVDGASEIPAPPPPGYSSPPPGAQVQSRRNPKRRWALAVVCVVVVLAAAIVSVVLWQRHQAGARDVRVLARNSSTESQVDVSSGDLRSVDSTDLVLVVEFSGRVEPGDQANTIRVTGTGDSSLDGTATVRVFAGQGTLAEWNAPVQYGSWALPEFEPGNEIGIAVEVLNERQIQVSSAAGTFPAARQFALELDYGYQNGYIAARLFTD